jgi:hypothetical protein
MIRTTIYLTHRGQGQAHDDVIHISTNEESRELFDVVYKTPDLRRSKAFTTTESHVLDYVGDLLRAVAIDSDPFENVQLMTAIHPSIFYHVIDLDTPSVRGDIISMIRMSLRMDVRTK